MLIFYQWIKNTDCLRGLTWSLIGGCGKQKLSVKKRLMQSLKAVDTFAQLKSMLAFASFKFVVYGLMSIRVVNYTNCATQHVCVVRSYSRIYRLTLCSWFIYFLSFPSIKCLIYVLFCVPLNKYYSYMRLMVYVAR